MAKIWTEEQEDYIRDHYRQQTYSELAEHFGVTQKAMESKIRRLGLKKQDPPPQASEAALFAPPQLAPEPVAADSGPTPLRGLGSLPRRPGAPTETTEQRRERLAQEVAAAEQEKQTREQHRDSKEIKKALKLFEKGLKLYHDGSFVKATDQFQAVLDSSPVDMALLQRARQYVHMCARKRLPAAFSPQDAEEHYLSGVMLLNSGDPGRALQAFAAALDEAPGDDRILYCQAAAHAQKGDVDAAIHALREAVDINESNRIYAINDSDFVPLRVHEGFKEVVASPNPSRKR